MDKVGPHIMLLKYYILLCAFCLVLVLRDGTQTYARLALEPQNSLSLASDFLL